MVAIDKHNFMDSTFFFKKIMPPSARDLTSGPAWSGFASYTSKRAALANNMVRDSTSRTRHASPTAGSKPPVPADVIRQPKRIEQFRLLLNGKLHA